MDSFCGLSFCHSFISWLNHWPPFWGCCENRVFAAQDGGMRAAVPRGRRSVARRRDRQWVELRRDRCMGCFQRPGSCRESHAPRRDDRAREWRWGRTSRQLRGCATCSGRAWPTASFPSRKRAPSNTGVRSQGLMWLWLSGLRFQSRGRFCCCPRWPSHAGRRAAPGGALRRRGDA